MLEMCLATTRGASERGVENRLVQVKWVMQHSAARGEIFAWLKKRQEAFVLNGSSLHRQGLTQKTVHQEPSSLSQGTGILLKERTDYGYCDLNNTLVSQGPPRLSRKPIV